ncbi:MAG: HD-GYP domain-containing protein [Lachnospiraceae bacterium]
MGNDKMKKINIVYNSSLAMFKNMLSGVINGTCDLDINTFLHINVSMQNCVSSSEELIEYIYDRPLKNDEMIYSHCLNCGLLSGIFAKWTDFSEDEINDIMISGFLIDFGLLLIPNEIVMKNEKLTDLEFLHIKGHPMKAFQFLSDKNVPDTVLKAILMHHEKCDGSGYPSKLKENQISRYAKLLSITDTYEALTSDRTYRSAKNTFEAVQIMIQEKGKYDSEMLSKILSKIALMQIGKVATLSDGKEGKIIMINPNDVSKPVLKTEQNEIINLNLKKDLSIVSCK